MLTPSPRRELSRHPIIAILTALPKELAAVKCAVDDLQPISIPGAGAGRRYEVGTVPAAGGGHHTVVTALADMGNNIASARAALLLEHFPSVRSILMVGIAGGVPSPGKADEHVRLGDIVVSNQAGVVQYDFVKETAHEIIPRHPPRPPAPDLLEAARLLQASELHGERPWLAHLERVLACLAVARPSSRRDVLFAEDGSTQRVRHPPDPQRSRGYPRVFLGPIASANRLLKSSKHRDLLRDRFGAKAVEMEGSGIADSTWNHQAGYLVIRGVCDYCDAHKNDTWQHYAAAVAAAYGRALLETIPAQGAITDETREPARPLIRVQKMRGDLVMGNKLVMKKS
jgi:nucleoside phosphorylase